MSLLDNVKQTIGSAASSALEMGQNLGAQAAAQINIKKLQVEHAKKLQDLGVRTYEWHKSGTLFTAGVVPHQIHELCHAIDELNTQIDDQQLKLEEAKREAEARSAKPAVAAPVESAPIPMPAAAPPAGPAATAPAAATPSAGPPISPTPQHAAQPHVGMTVAAPPLVPATSPPAATAPPVVRQEPITQILGETMQAMPPVTAQIGGPDITQPTIPVPGPDMPSHSPSQPTMPSSPSPDANPPLPTQPTLPSGPGPDMPMPGQPSSPTM